MTEDAKNPTVQPVPLLEPEWFVPQGEPTEEQQYFTGRIVDILNEKDASGAYVYTHKEVRDFIVACTLSAGLEVNKEIGLVMLEFLSELKGPKEDDTHEQVLDHIRAYFQEHPLNKQLQSEFFQWGRGELLKKGEGFKDVGKQLAAAKAAGNAAGVQVPLVTPPKAPSPKLKKGIGR